MEKLINQIFKEIQTVRAAGQKEYARQENNAFANFERVADYIDSDRQKVLMVYLLKHVDGIASFVNGHKSQREDVRGRITDAIVYLCLLWGMIDDNKNLIEKIKDNWKKILENINKENSKTAIFLEDSYPDKIVDECLHMIVRGMNDFSIRALKKDTEFITKIINSTMNTNLSISIGYFYKGYGCEKGEKNDKVS